MSWNGRKVAGATVAATGGAALGDWMNKQGNTGKWGAAALGVAPLAYGEHVVAGDQPFSWRGTREAFSPYANWQGNRARDRDKSSTDAYNTRTQQQIAGRNGLLDQRAALLDSYRSEDDAARGKALGSLQQAYADPTRAAAIQQGYDANLQNALAGLNAQYQQGAQSQALANAHRGRTGSSYAAERAAGLQNQYQTGAVNAASDAYNYSQGLSDADYNQQQALRRAILSGDPQSAAAYQAQAAGATNASQALAGRSALEDRQRVYDEAVGNAQSRQYGGYVTGIGNYYRYGMNNGGA